MITLDNVSFFHGARLIFENVDLTLVAKHKIGVVGKNGSGKTTLFGLLRGVLSTSRGEIRMSTGLRIAHLAQESPASELSALEFTVQGDTELAELEAALKHAEQTEDYDALMDIYARMSDIDAYTARARAGQLLKGLGFDDEQQQLPVNTFSGGWRMRLNLAQTLMSRSDVLLLDEPTNHLDLPAILWLETWLKQYSGTLLLISHDRDFLDSVVNHIVHVYHQSIKLYSGDYSNFERQFAEQLALQQKSYEKQQAKITHMMKFVDKFRYKASKARQAQSRLKAIERMPTIAAIQQDSDFQFEFMSPEFLPNPMVTLRKADLGYDGEAVLRRVDMQLQPGDRVGLLGANGAGKSTLIKALVGELPLIAGDRLAAEKLTIGYFAQHQMEYLQLDQTAVQHMQKLAPNKPERELRGYLGQFGFGQELALTPVGRCSGGEKARLVLAMLVWRKPALLLLDEPTNHLDMDMRNALTLALQNYEGALLVVSHDRYLIRATTDRLWLVANQSVKRFDGDMEDYQQLMLQE